MIATIRQHKIWMIFIALSVVYILEALLIPPDSSALNKFKISGTEAKLLGLTVVVPIVCIWLMGCYVYTRFRSYAQSIVDDKDGKAFQIIQYGMLLLFLWLPISSVVSNMSNYMYREHPSWTIPLVIFNNYLNLALVLSAFALIYRGAYSLTKLKESRSSSSLKYLAILPLVAISELFIFLNLNNPARQYPTADTPVAGFYLPDWLLVGTIIIPYIMVFFYGFFAVVHIYIYRKKVRGIIYKDALDSLAKGLLCITTSIIVIRYLASLTTLFSSATLKIILLILYMLLAVLLLGSILLVQSVKKLHAIEKV